MLIETLAPGTTSPGRWPATSSSSASTVDFGLTYALSEDIQLDGGVDVGVTRATEDVTPFPGLSVRL